MGRRGALVLVWMLIGASATTAAPQETHIDTPATESVAIEYVAHSCFRFSSSGGDRVLIDPFASRIWLGYSFPRGIDSDVILISHPHYDHDGGVFVERRPPWPKGSRVIREPGAYQIGDFNVLGVTGKHADPWRKEFGQTNTIWLLDVSGIRIAHLGDNGPISEDAIEKLGRVDVLLIPIDSEFHILKREEIEGILAKLSPRVVIPMHYRHPDLESDADSPKGLGEIGPWLKSRPNFRQVSSHKLLLSAGKIATREEILVLEHWPNMNSR
jgi:L-ascorbate metabolism protein UlaG (beta-lactamase superfamily)